MFVMHAVLVSNELSLSSALQVSIANLIIHLHPVQVQPPLQGGALAVHGSCA